MTCAALRPAHAAVDVGAILVGTLQVPVQVHLPEGQEARRQQGEGVRAHLRGYGAHLRLRRARVRTRGLLGHLAALRNMLPRPNPSPAVLGWLPLMAMPRARSQGVATTLTPPRKHAVRGAHACPVCPVPRAPAPLGQAERCSLGNIDARMHSSSHPMVFGCRSCRARWGEKGKMPEEAYFTTNLQVLENGEAEVECQRPSCGPPSDRTPPPLFCPSAQRDHDLRRGVHALPLRLTQAV